MDSLKSFASQLTGRSGVAALEKKSPDDVVITLAIRTPLCKARKGGLKDARSARAFRLAVLSCSLLATGPMNS